MNTEFWRGKRVFLTGHTGFKGSWLALWLHDLGARVYGFALPAPTSPSLFDVAQVQSMLAGHTLADIRDPSAVAAALEASQADIVFHLAAQPLVRRSYVDPLETFATNVIGTANLLQACRSARGLQAVVNVTTDKCYENKEWAWGYRENEPLGGHDPYSASKACAEIVTSAMRNSFFGEGDAPIASARAGNVIGGGDWAEDRLLPDFFRAFDADKQLIVRSPNATRPWQHVLEPLAGYIRLAEMLATQGHAFANAWNFGPADDDARSVGEILDILSGLTGKAGWKLSGEPQPHEAHYLKLDSSRAKSLLGWRPRLRLEEALRYTLDWHHAWRDNRDMAAFCRTQIGTYTDS